MSWQKQFDENGPVWRENAAALVEEKRLQKLADDSNKKNLPTESSNCDPSALENLDREMRSLYEQEKKLLLQLGQCNNAQEKVGIEDRIHSVRREFGKVKDEYIQMRELQK